MKVKFTMFVVVGLMVVGMVGAADQQALLQKGMVSTGTSATDVRGVEALLYDQTDNVGTNGVPSQFFPDFGGGAYAADDFVVPAAGWDVEQVMALGSYSGAGVGASWDVVIYADSGGMPGTEVFSQAGIAATSDVAGDVTIDLAPVAILPAGTYWLSVVCNMNFNPDGQWFWTTRAVQAGGPYHWEDRDGLFGVTACPTWGPGATVCGVGGGLDPDLLFMLNGTVLPVELQSFSVE